MTNHVANPNFSCILDSILGKNIKKVLFIATHPDDLEFFAGGSAAKYVSAGKIVKQIILTDGRMGYCSNISRNQLALRRIKEARKAAKIIGLNGVRFLNSFFREFEIVDNVSSVNYLADVISKLNPEVIFCPTYKFPVDFWNKDHKITGRIVEKVCKKLNLPLFFYGSFRQTFIEPFSNSFFMDSKRAIKAHESQIQIFGKIYLILRSILTRYYGKRTKSKYAEPFLRIN
jgi:LmbE family N-acetylglucosaminyl deacetylase